MNSDEDVETLKRKFLKEKRQTAFVFGILSMVTLVILVYAFFKQTEANKARITFEVQLRDCEKRVEDAQQKLLDQRKVFEAEKNQAGKKVEQ